MLPVLALTSNASAAEPPFAPEVPIFAEDISSATAAHFADLDRDGDLDIVLAGGTSVYWFENTGDLSEPMTERNVDPGLFSSEEMFITDVDADGDLDIINVGEGLRWYENIEDAAGFQRHDVVDGDDVTGKIGFGDVDGDGLRDLILANTDTDTLSVLTNEGEAQFGAPVDVPVDLSSVDYVAVADFLGDGRAEIAVSGSYGNTLLLLERADDGGWTSYALDPGTGVEELRAADVDGDDAIDLLVGGDEHADVLINLGGGVFGSEPVATSDASDVGYQLVAADIDADGDADVVSSRWSTENALAWHANDGGSFGPEQTIIDQIDGFAFLDAGDADCDGDDDIIALAAVDDLLAVYVLENATLEPMGEPSPECIGAGDDGAVAADDDDDDDGGTGSTGGDASDESGDGTDGGETGGDDAGESSGGSGGGETSGGSGDVGQDEDDGGGLCSVHPRRGLPATALVLLGLFGFRRRRG